MAPRTAQKAPPPKVNKVKRQAKKTAPPPPPPPPKASKKRRVPSSSPDDEDAPAWDQGVRTKAAREHTRIKLSRVSLHEDLDESYIVEQAQKLIGESRNSWGASESNPIEATRCQRRRKTRGGFRRGGVENACLEMMGDIRPPTRVPVPNNIARSPILRVSLEIRERFYAYLLIYPTAIMVKPDWMTVERNPFVDHSILRTCKQFAFEGTNFLYRNNTFQTLIRNPSTAMCLRSDAPASIPKIHHCFLRNLVIECSKTCWNMVWYEKATEGLNILAAANPVIESLTLSVVPERVGMSTTALGMEVSPVTFADFLWYPGPFMQAVRKLAPRRFKVVVKKSGGRKLGMEDLLNYLRVYTEEDNILANAETVKLRDARTHIMEDELSRLKGRFEEVFENDQWAVSEGLCTLLDAGGSRTNEGELMNRAGRGGLPMPNGTNRSGTTGSASRSLRERSESEEMWVY